MAIQKGIGIGKAFSGFGKPVNITRLLNGEQHLQENLRWLHDAFIVAPDLLEAYEALPIFHDIRASSPFSVQSEKLTEWIRKYASSRVEEIRSVACTIQHWRSYIQNSWKYGKSNGLSEGQNNKIKVLKRVSFRFTQL